MVLMLSYIIFRLLYGLELAYLAGKKYGKARNDLYRKVKAIASVANIPEIMVQGELIEKILHTDYLDNAGIDEFEHIRKNLRGLMKYIPKTEHRYDTNFEDDILSMEWKESELDNDELKNYKAKRIKTNRTCLVPIRLDQGRQFILNK